MFFKDVPNLRGRTWDLLAFVYFLSEWQRLTPLGFYIRGSVLLNSNRELLFPTWHCRWLSKMAIENFGNLQCVILLFLVI